MLVVTRVSGRWRSTKIPWTAWRNSIFQQLAAGPNRARKCMETHQQGALFYRRIDTGSIYREALAYKCLIKLGCQLRWLQATGIHWREDSKSVMGRPFRQKESWGVAVQRVQPGKWYKSKVARRALRDQRRQAAESDRANRNLGKRSVNAAQMDSSRIYALQSLWL